MKIRKAYRQVRADDSGATAIEFALTAPAFMLILMGIIEFSLMMWTQVGLQHGTTMAARCASASKNAGADAVDCKTTAQIQQYAARMAYGLNPSPTVFSVDLQQPCGSQITANFPFRFVVTYFMTPSITLNARSCFPRS